MACDMNSPPARVHPNAPEVSASINRPLGLLLPAVYDNARLHPEHLADLRRSTLTGDTISRQMICSVPAHMIDTLLGFAPRGVVSAYLLPFPDPRGGWMNHVRLK